MFERRKFVLPPEWKAKVSADMATSLLRLWQLVDAVDRETLHSHLEQPITAEDNWNFMQVRSGKQYQMRNCLGNVLKEFSTPSTSFCIEVSLYSSAPLYSDATLLMLHPSILGHCFRRRALILYIDRETEIQRRGSLSRRWPAASRTANNWMSPNPNCMTFWEMHGLVFCGSRCGPNDVTYSSIWWGEDITPRINTNVKNHQTSKNECHENLIRSNGNYVNPFKKVKVTSLCCGDPLTWVKTKFFLCRMRWLVMCSAGTGHSKRQRLKLDWKSHLIFYSRFFRVRFHLSRYFWKIKCSRF